MRSCLMSGRSSAEREKIMGLPIREASGGSPEASSAEAKASASCNGNVSSESPSSSSSSVSHVFVYGNTRPDISPSPIVEGANAQRAWLLGSRLYSRNTGGAQVPALRLEEPGHAVLGYTMSVGSAGGIGRLLDSFERREYSPQFYERDVVEVVTEGGERVQSYVYHQQEIDRSTPVQGGDWLQHFQS